VEAGEDHWAPRMEAQPLHPVALGLELGQHPPWPWRRPANGPSRGGGEEAGDEGGDGENAMDNLGEEMERDLGEERSTG
jgi:hypothetical protein